MLQAKVLQTKVLQAKVLQATFPSDFINNFNLLLTLFLLHLIYLKMFEQQQTCNKPIKSHLFQLIFRFDQYSKFSCNTFLLHFTFLKCLSSSYNNWCNILTSQSNILEYLNIRSDLINMFNFPCNTFPL